jgi:hypothetical protein
MLTKTCSQCGQEKPLADFARLRRSRDGHRGYCKTCGKKYRDRYRETHIAELAERLSEWRTLNVDYYRNYQKLYHRGRRSRLRDAASSL